MPQPCEESVSVNGAQIAVLGTLVTISGVCLVLWYRKRQSRQLLLFASIACVVATGIYGGIVAVSSSKGRTCTGDSSSSSGDKPQQHQTVAAATLNNTRVATSRAVTSLNNTRAAAAVTTSLNNTRVATSRAVTSLNNIRAATHLPRATVATMIAL